MIVVGNTLQTRFLVEALHEKGIDYLVIPTREPVSTSLDLRSTAYETPLDYLTRYQHSFGDTYVHQIVRASKTAYQSFKDYLDERGISYQSGDIERHATDKLEADEQVNTHKIYKNLLGATNSQITLEEHKIIHHDAALTFDRKEVKKKLSTDSRCSGSNLATLEVEDHGCMVRTLDGKKYNSEFCVLANTWNAHEAIKFLETSLIPITDQINYWTSENFDTSPILSFTKYNLIEASKTTHGFENIGASFLRHDNTKRFAVNDKISEFCRSEFEKAGSLFKDQGSKESQVVVKTSTCDERPLFGPWPGHERLIACYPCHGSEIALAHLFAQETCNILLLGRTESDCEAFLARRLRTIDS